MTRLLGNRLTVAFGLALALLITNAIVSYRATDTLIETNRWVLRSQALIAELATTISTVKDAETGHRGYLITGDQRFLKPYEDAVTRIDQHFKRLRDLTTDNPAQRQRISTLERTTTERLATLHAGIDLFRRAGLDAVRQSGLLDSGKTEMDRIRQLTSAMEADENRLLEGRTEDARRSGRDTILTFSVATLLVLALLVLVYYLINRDIGERMRAQDALRAAHDSLETRVRERTTELATANIELERSNRELQDFASVASHDLQEPLRKIQTFGDRLKTKHGDRLGDEGRDYLERMQNAASRMQTLINDLLTFSRVTSKAQPFVTVNLGDIAQQVVEDLEARVQQTGGRVNIGALPTIEADPLQMRQLLQNLIGNALKFHRTDEPPIVTISSPPFPDKGENIALSSTGRLCQIIVEDNGIGFDVKYLDRIFTPFQRLHGRNEYEGTGMGLAVCRKIVERHGGSITATSLPGRGTTFIVMLPVVHTNGETAE